MEHIWLVCVLSVLWIYLTGILFTIFANKSMYIQNIPIIDNELNTYQLQYFIPTCLFTNYFDKRVTY
jgi:hypothetical protein